MPEECPKCGEERCYIHGPRAAKEDSAIELIEGEDGWLDRNLNARWLCKRCGFKWIEFYQENEWTSLEEFEGGNYNAACSWRSPVYPYKETNREPPHWESGLPDSTRFGPFAKAYKEQCDAEWGVSEEKTKNEPLGTLPVDDRTNIEVRDSTGRLKKRA